MAAPVKSNNPDFLFFDEATNSLDTINEQKIVNALDDVFKEKTVIVVAHRLSTIRKAHQIIVIKDGSVAEIGNHESLIAKKGHYAMLVQSQFDSPLKTEDNKVSQQEKFADLL